MSVTGHTSYFDNSDMKVCQYAVKLLAGLVVRCVLADRTMVRTACARVAV